MAHLDLHSAHRFVRGQLTPEEASAWQEHLNICGRCRALVAAEREFLGLLEIGTSPVAAPQATREAPPESFLHKLPRSTSGPRRRTRAARRTRLAPLAGTIVCAVLAGLLGWQVLRAPGAADAAGEARITPELQRVAVSHLPAIVAIENEPWLASEYDIVIALEQLILHQTEPYDAGSG